MTPKELERQYWHYYLHLEKQFLNTIEYCELENANYNTFSNAYVLLMQSIGAELDTFFKVYCGFSTSDRKTIADYETAITNEDNNANPFDFSIRDQVITIPQYGISIKPFDGWDSNYPAQSLNWWQAFTSLKHDRFANRFNGNQKNTLDILGALYLLEMRELKKITDGTDELDTFGNSSELFSLEKWSSKAVPVNQMLFVFTDMLEGKTIPKFDV